MGYLAIDQLQELLDKHPFAKDNKILEAGCGSFTHVTVPGNNYIVGIDISDEQLEKNSKLSEKINADIQFYDFPENAYDLIICWDVLEHLEFPDKALNNFKRAVKPEGLIILAMPNVQSLKGLITKFTPHWFHILVYKWIFKKADAGQPGCAPFPTFLKYSIAPRSIEKYANANDMKVLYMRLYDRFPRVVREQQKSLFLLYKLLSALVSIITLGKFGGVNNTDYVCVLQK